MASHASCARPGLADGGERHALGLDPQPELHADAVRVVGEARQAGGKTLRVDGPRAEPGVEIEVAGLAGADVPAGVHDEQLDAERRGAIDLGDHRVLVDARAVDEPGVVGDERLERPTVTDALQHELAQRAGLVGRSPSRRRRRTCAGSSNGLDEVTLVPTPGNETPTRSRSSARSSEARQAPDHISPP